MSSNCVGRTKTVKIGNLKQEAEDICIEDAGGHFESDVLEEALQEIGESIGEFEADLTLIECATGLAADTTTAQFVTSASRRFARLFRLMDAQLIISIASEPSYLASPVDTSFSRESFKALQSAQI